MTTSGRHTLQLGVAAALLAGCGGSQPPISVPGAAALITQETTPVRTIKAARVGGASSTYQVIYSSGGGSDGEGPTANLIDVNRALFTVRRR